jgi:hypothetical protein
MAITLRSDNPQRKLSGAQFLRFAGGRPSVHRHRSHRNRLDEVTAWPQADNRHISPAASDCTPVAGNRFAFAIRA